MPPLFLSEQIVFLERVAKLVVTKVERFGGLALVIAAFSKRLFQHRLFIFFGGFAKVADVNRLTQIR